MSQDEDADEAQVGDSEVLRSPEIFDKVSERVAARAGRVLEERFEYEFRGHAGPLPTPDDLGAWVANATRNANKGNGEGKGPHAALILAAGGPARARRSRPGALGARWPLWPAI